MQVVLLLLVLMLIVIAIAVVPVYAVLYYLDHRRAAGRPVGSRR